MFGVVLHRRALQLRLRHRRTSAGRSTRSIRSIPGWSTIGPIIDNPEYSLKQQSIYAQDRITLCDRLHVDLGLRYDWIETDAGLGRADPTQQLDDERALDQRRAALRHGQRRLALCQLLGVLLPGGLRDRRRRQPVRADPRHPVRGRREVPAAGHDLALHRRGLRHHQVEHAGHRPDRSQLRRSRTARRSRGASSSAPRPTGAASRSTRPTPTSTPRTRTASRFAGVPREPGLGLAAVRRGRAGSPG